MDKYNTLGERIRLARQKKGLSQAELAKELNCTQGALSQYERGAREPGLSDLVNIANALNTTTDYLLGCTDISSKDISVKKIGDYLGLNEEAILKLHEMYMDRKGKTEEAYLVKEVELFNSAIPGEEEYPKTYEYIRGDNQQCLFDYTDALNGFICSHEFSLLVRKLINNRFLERNIYDLLRIVMKRYDDLESIVFAENVAEHALCVSEEGENFLQQYLLNMFEIQNSIMGFSQKFTKLEAINQIENSDAFYRMIHYYVYVTTHPMFDAKHYSVEKMEKQLEFVLERHGEQIEEILKVTK